MISAINDYASAIMAISAVLTFVALFVQVVILIRRGRSKGWLKVRGLRFWRVLGYSTPQGQYESLHGVGATFYLEITNTGNFRESVHRIEYYVKGDRWRWVGPSGQSAKPVDDGLEGESHELPVMSIEPLATNIYRYDLRECDVPLVTCVRLYTAKETIHVRLRGRGGIPPHRWERFGLLCKFGIHL